MKFSKTTCSEISGTLSVFGGGVCIVSFSIESSKYL
jgi:hypothetical protein